MTTVTRRAAIAGTVASVALVSTEATANTPDPHPEWLEEWEMLNACACEFASSLRHMERPEMTPFQPDGVQGLPGFTDLKALVGWLDRMAPHHVIEPTARAALREYREKTVDDFIEHERQHRATLPETEYGQRLQAAQDCVTRMCELEDLLFDTPATTAAGLQAQLRAVQLAYARPEGVDLHRTLESGSYWPVFDDWQMDASAPLGALERIYSNLAIGEPV